MAPTEQEKFEFASRVGVEAFELMQQRIEELGPFLADAGTTYTSRGALKCARPE